MRIESKLENFACSLVIQRSGTKEEEEQRDVEKREKERTEIQQAVGLSMLMRKIADSVRFDQYVLIEKIENNKIYFVSGKISSWS